MSKLSSKLTYANVTATLALIIALGGASAFAATQLAKNSVGSKQLKKNAVTTAKIKKEAVTAANVKSGTLTGTQINASTLGTVPTATNAATATTADSLAPPEPMRLVGSPGQPPFLDGSGGVPAAAIEFSPAGFYKDREGIVHLEGVSEIGFETNPIKGLIFTLPSGYRPASGIALSFSVGEGNEKVVVFGPNATYEGEDVGGDVWYANESGVAHLSGITFRAES